MSYGKTIFSFDCVSIFSSFFLPYSVSKCDQGGGGGAQGELLGLRANLFKVKQWSWEVTVNAIAMTKEGSLLTVGLKVTVTDRQHSFCLKLQKAPSGPHMHRIKWIREEFKKTCINEVNNHANLVSE